MNTNKGKQVVHTRGAILEETHYYPFGLTMAGISTHTENFGGYNSTSSGGCGCPNKKGFNGNERQQNEFSDGAGLNYYDFNARTYEQQIGRFAQIDPDLEEGGQESLTPYQFGFNNPVRYNDPDGRCPFCIFAVPTIIEGVAYLGGAVLTYFGVKAVQPAIKKGIDNLSIPATGTGTAPVAASGSAAQQDLAFERQTWVKSSSGEKPANKSASENKAGSALKKVPNPNGKKGGEAHQQTVNNEEQRLKNDGFDKVEREVKVETPGGNKEKRYLDLKGTNTKTGETQEVQVGKQNQNGTPVSRERKALDDIQKANPNGVRPVFTPYN